MTYLSTLGPYWNECGNAECSWVGKLIGVQNLKIAHSPLVYSLMCGYINK